MRLEVPNQAYVTVLSKVTIDLSRRIHYRGNLGREGMFGRHPARLQYHQSEKSGVLSRFLICGVGCQDLRGERRFTSGQTPSAIRQQLLDSDFLD